MPVHAVPGVHVPPHPSLGVEPHGRVEGGVHEGAQQAPPRQRSPAGHIVPAAHIGQPGGSLGSVPHASEAGEGQAGQHEPPMQLAPAAHIVPVPHIRQMAPVVSRESGISTPHGTLDADGQSGQHEPPVHVDPAGHIVPAPQSRQTAPLESSTSGTGAPHATVPALGQLPQQVRSSGIGIPGGFTHEVPAAQREPTPVQVRHAGSGIGSPQSTLEALAQFGQHVPPTPPVQLVPAPQPAVPVPLQTRQIAPLASVTSGMSIPQGTLEAAGQAPQQVCVSAPGGSTHIVPAGHMLPKPGHVRHVAPPAMGSGISSPQGTLAGAAQAVQHEPAMHVAPDGQRVPVPAQGSLPMQVSGTSSPQSTIAAGTHVSAQVHTPAMHVRESGQGPMHLPPHPSLAPHGASGAQRGMHSQRPVSGLHSSLGEAQVPVQKPPQPSSAPQTPSGAHEGVQMQRFATQRAGGMHGGSQPQVSTQVPF